MAGCYVGLVQHDDAAGRGVVLQVPTGMFVEVEMRARVEQLVLHDAILERTDTTKARRCRIYATSASEQPMTKMGAFLLLTSDDPKQHSVKQLHHGASAGATPLRCPALACNRSRRRPAPQSHRDDGHVLIWAHRTASAAT